MNNMNMRRVLQQPTLRMAEGGSVSPWSIKGIANSIKAATTQTPAQEAKAAALREYQARSAAERAAPAAPVPAPAPAPAQVSNPLGNQSVIDARMKAAGLRHGGDLRTGHGGDVPGKGKGDKIPAKYEPGEFVVSNDMLDAKPSLRGELRALRKKVLAQKGMTPEQADAKALGQKPGSLRAEEGFLKQIPGVIGDEPNPGRVSNWRDDSELGRNINNGMNALSGMGVVANVPLKAAAAVENASVAERVMPAGIAIGNNQARLAAPVEKATAAVNGAAPVFNVASNGVATAQHGVPAVYKAAEAARGPLPGTIPGLMEGANANKNAANIRSVAGYNNMEGQANAEQLRDAQTPDSPGMADYKRQMGNVGKFFMNGAKSIVGAPGEAEKYTAPAGAAPAAPVSTTTPAPTPQPKPNLGYSGDATGPANELRDNSIRVEYNDKGVPTFSGNGNADRYSGDLRNGFDKKDNKISIMPGMDPAAIKAAMTNPDGSAWTAQDTAIMNANLRDGVDAYRGTSRGQPGGATVFDDSKRIDDYNRWSADVDTRSKDDKTRASGIARVAQFGLRDQTNANNAAGLQKARMEADTAARTHAETNKTTLRAAEINAQSHRDVANAPLRLAEAQQKRLAAIMEAAKKGGKGRVGQIDPIKLALEIGDKDSAKALQDMRTAELGNKGTEQTQTDKAVGNMKDATKVYGADNKEDGAKSAGAFKVMQKLFPGYTTSDTTTQQDHAPEIEALTKIYGRTFERNRMGWDKVNPLKPRAPQLDTMPDFHKAKQFMKAGPNTGLTNVGISTGDYYIQQKDGTYVPLGADLGENEINAIRHNMKTGQWRGASKS